MPAIDLTFINTVVGIVVLYYFFLFGHVTYKRIQGRTFSNPDYTPFMFVVIPAHNEADVIKRKVENSLALRYPREKLEILVVDDGSDDGTDSVVASYAAPPFLNKPSLIFKDAFASRFP